ncbi:MAG: MFS transporter [Pseudomonadota bacterium]
MTQGHSPVAAENRINRTRAIVFTVAMASFMGRLDGYIVNISLPTIVHDFHAPIATASMVILAYTLALAGFTMIAGTLGDHLGLKRMLLGGYALFTASSLACGLAPSAPWLIGARFVQGLGGAMLLSMSYATVTRSLSRDKVGSAMGTLATAAAMGTLLGAPLGGLLSGFLSWHWVFWVNLPIGILALWMANRVLPADPQPSRAASDLRFDVLGATMSFGGLGLLIFTLALWHRLGGAQLSTIALLTTSLALLAGFLGWEARHPNPILDLSLFQNRVFALGLLSKFIVFLQLAAHGFMIPFYLELLRRMNAQQSGLMVALFPAAILVAAPLSGRLADRMAPSRLATAAMVSGTGANVFFTATLSLDATWPPVVYLLWMGLSFGFYLPPNNKLVLMNVPDNRRGSATSVFQTSGNLGLPLGVVLATVIFGSNTLGSHGLNGLRQLTQHAPASVADGFGRVYLMGAALCLAAAVSVWAAGKGVHAANLDSGVGAKP